MPIAIATQDLTKHYQMGQARVRALDGVSVTVSEGEFVALVGTSGSGKSTLLSLIGGLDQATGGTITVFGQDLARMSRQKLSEYRRRSVGIIFQSFNLVPTMTALENVALAMMFAGRAHSERDARARELLSSMGLRERVTHRPREMSGGEQQRVAIARALANDPPLLLADEPTGNLDSRTSREIMDLLATLNRNGKTIVMVTHDAALAAQYAHRTVAMLDGAVVAEPAA
jgi:putative ABC transport system ATP-binding protein